MKLLDDMPESAEAYVAQIEGASAVMADYFARHPASTKAESIRKALMSGDSPAVVLGIERRHRDAMLATAGRLLKIGQVEQARDWLQFLFVLEPFDERAAYMLAMATQLSGDLATAAKLYVQFLALDATNPDGHLRLGECLLANGEVEDATGCFRTALALVDGGRGTPATRDHARRLLAAAEERAA